MPLPEAETLGLYSRKTLSGRKLDCYFCKTCGSRIMHRSGEEETLSIKGGCLEGLDLKEAKHIWCKEAIVEIPKGVEAYAEEPPGDGESMNATASKT